VHHDLIAFDGMGNALLGEHVGRHFGIGDGDKGIELAVVLDVLIHLPRGDYPAGADIQADSGGFRFASIHLKSPDPHSDARIMFPRIHGPATGSS